jgi:hypothetical protein
MFFAFFAGSKSIFIICLYIQINGPSTLTRRVFDHETDCTAPHRPISLSTIFPIARKLQIAIDFRFTFSFNDCVHKWLPCSIRIQLLPESDSNPCGRCRRHWS